MLTIVSTKYLIFHQAAIIGFSCYLKFRSSSHYQVRHRAHLQPRTYEGKRVNQTERRFLNKMALRLFSAKKFHHLKNQIQKANTLIFTEENVTLRRRMLCASPSRQFSWDTKLSECCSVIMASQQAEVVRQASCPLRLERMHFRPSLGAHLPPGQ